ncbi:MAG: HEAT repeat domain-containing protein [Armatimonadota bacterium]|nr:HEAT repeat domain-containing protein [Armatimonadota bacterium]
MYGEEEVSTIRRSFKSDTSFLEKISMGATGTRAVLSDLEGQGHQPIELERGSTSFKIWKNIKIKRIRVPDILCVACGRCVESRAKTKLEISMSHSEADPERGWDYGLADEDFVGLVACEKDGEEPVAWTTAGPVQYVRVEALRKAAEEGSAVVSRPKGAQEGFEIRIIWPTSKASAAGTITNVDEKRIQYERASDGRTITLQRQKKDRELSALVVEGEEVDRNQILASVVPVVKGFECEESATGSDYIRALESPSLTDRYTGVKALGTIRSGDVTDALAAKVTDEGEHIYVRLEAAGGLARRGEALGYDFIAKCLRDDYLQNRLEAVIVLGEIESDRSCRMLIDVFVDDEQHPDIRAGAAWALGELRSKLAIEALIKSFASVEDRIRVEACRALGKVCEHFTPEVIERFPEAPDRLRPGIAWALSNAGEFEIDDMIDLLVDDDARQWVAYVVGTQDKDEYIGEIERLREKDPEVYFAVTVLWKIMTSWIWNVEEY